MKTRQDYIQFGKDNGFTIKDKVYTQETRYSLHTYEVEVRDLESYSYLEIITSKEFIEAIARGYGMTGRSYNRQPGDIAKEQAMAIYNNELESFITKIIK